VAVPLFVRLFRLLVFVGVGFFFLLHCGSFINILGENQKKKLAPVGAKKIFNKPIAVCIFFLVRRSIFVSRVALFFCRAQRLRISVLRVSVLRIRNEKKKLKKQNKMSDTFFWAPRITGLLRKAKELTFSRYFFC